MLWRRRSREGFRVPDAVSPWRNGRWPISPSTSPRGRVPPAAGWVKSPPLDESAVLDENRSLRDGGVLIWQHDFVIDYQTAILKEAAAHYGLEFDEHTPIKEYVGALRDLLLYGVESEEFKRHFPEVKPPKTVRKGKFEGVITG